MIRLNRPEISWKPGCLPDFAEELFNRCHGVIAIHLGDKIEGDALGANRLALTVIGAVSKTSFIHGCNHAKHPAILFRLPLRK